MRGTTTIRPGPVHRATRRPPGRLDSHCRRTDRRGLVNPVNSSDLSGHMQCVDCGSGGYVPSPSACQPNWFVCHAKALWRESHVQQAAHFTVNAVAVVPYFSYYASYRANQWMAGHRWTNYVPTCRVLRLALLANQIYSLHVDMRLDRWKSHHLTGVHESAYDEHVYGSFCPSAFVSHVSACRKGGRLYGWLPGAYSRNHKHYFDYAR